MQRNLQDKANTIYFNWKFIVITVIAIVVINYSYAEIHIMVLVWHTLVLINYVRLKSFNRIRKTINVSFITHVTPYLLFAANYSENSKMWHKLGQNVELQLKMVTKMEQAFRQNHLDYLLWQYFCLFYNIKFCERTLSTE